MRCCEARVFFLNVETSLVMGQTSLSEREA